MRPSVESAPEARPPAPAPIVPPALESLGGYDAAVQPTWWERLLTRRKTGTDSDVFAPGRSGVARMAALTAVVIAVAVLAAHLADITREKSRKPHPVVPPRPVATTKQVLATPDDVRRVADALVALAQEATVANGQTGPEHDHLVQRHQARLMSLLHEQRLVAQRIQGHRDLTQLAEEVGRHAALYIVSTERLPMVPSASELTAAMAAAKQLDEAVGATPPTASAN